MLKMTTFKSEMHLNYFANENYFNLMLLYAKFEFAPFCRNSALRMCRYLRVMNNKP